VPVDLTIINSLLDELSPPAELRKGMSEFLSSNEDAAKQFVGQRMRNSDYTRKRQEEAALLQQVETENKQKLDAYAQQLSEAQDRITKIMADYEGESVSRAQAQARLRAVKEKYSLGDDDIPAVPVDRDKVKPADNTIDFEARFKALREEVVNDTVKRLLPELAAYPKLTVHQAAIANEYQSLTGKSLSEDDWDKVFDRQKKGGTLREAFEREFEIPKLRQDKHDETILSAARTKWDEEQKRKASDAALEGVTNRNAQLNNNQFSHSPVLGRKFQVQTEEQTGGTGAAPPPPNSPPPPPVQRLSGADRAALKYMERRNQGIPLGKEA
jgi:hypothetical protein